MSHAALPRSLDYLGKGHDSLPMRSSISSKGQITVPIEVRDRLGLRPGTVVHFEIVEGGALLKKGERKGSSIDAAYGILRLDRSVDTTIDEMRGPRPRRIRRA
jgi:AbrB family looped-hinge helix DNA binding protein